MPFFYENFWGWPAQDSCHRAQEAAPKCCGGCGVTPDPVLIHSVGVSHSGDSPRRIDCPGTKVSLFSTICVLRYLRFKNLLSTQRVKSPKKIRIHFGEY